MRIVTVWLEYWVHQTSTGVDNPTPTITYVIPREYTKLNLIRNTKYISCPRYPSPFSNNGDKNNPTQDKPLRVMILSEAPSSPRPPPTPSHWEKKATQKKKKINHVCTQR